MDLDLAAHRPRVIAAAPMTVDLCAAKLNFFTLKV